MATTLKEVGKESKAAQE